MKTVFNTIISEEIEDIDLTYYEKWVSLDSSLPLELIDNFIKDHFSDKYVFNEHIKPFCKTSYSNIEDLLNESEMDIYQSFKETLDNLDIKGYLNVLQKEPVVDMNYVVWPFSYYAGMMLNSKYPKLLAAQKPVIMNSLSYIMQSITNLALKMHILKMNEHPDYEMYSVEDNYDGFIRNIVLTEEFFQDFYLENPLFFARCFIRMNDLLSYVFEVLERLDQHFDLSNIQTIEYGEGDSHSGGKTVVQFSFKEDTWFYKPKNLKIEKFFYSFIELFGIRYNAKYLEENIYEKDFSLVRKVDYLPIETNSDAEGFYFNLGKIQFILYILGGNDIHYENIISNGIIPHIIDLETLFQINYDMVDSGDNEMTNQLKSQLELLQSIGILDLKLPGLDDAYDISALAGKGKKDAAKKETFVNANSMNLSVEEVYIDNYDKKNIPYFSNGKRVDYTMYKNHIINGFSAALKIFHRKKESIVAHIRALPDDLEVRNVLRPTFTYADFLFYSTHPTYMTDTLRYNKLLENLLGIPFNNKEVNQLEIQDIDKGDIPIFFSHIGEKNIYGSSHQNLGEFWTETPKQKSINRILSIDTQKENELILNLKTQLGFFTQNDKSMEERIDSLTLTPEVVFDLLTKKIQRESIFFNSILLSEKFTLEFTTIDYGLCNGLVGIWIFLQNFSEVNEQAKKLSEMIEQHLDTLELPILFVNEDALYNVGSLIFYFYLKSCRFTNDSYTEKFMYLADFINHSLLEQIFNLDGLNIISETDSEISHLNIYPYDVNVIPIESPSFIFEYFYRTKNEDLKSMGINLEEVFN